VSLLVTDDKLARAVAALTPEELEDWEERSAIMEHEGGLERAEAERLAWAMVRLAKSRPSPTSS
jgi:hypothetical protein